MLLPLRRGRGRKTEELKGETSTTGGRWYPDQRAFALSATVGPRVPAASVFSDGLLLGTPLYDIASETEAERASVTPLSQGESDEADPRLPADMCFHHAFREPTDNRAEGGGASPTGGDGRCRGRVCSRCWTPS